MPMIYKLSVIISTILAMNNWFNRVDTVSRSSKHDKMLLSDLGGDKTMVSILYIISVASSG